jgi:hypothetical protein
LTGVFCCTIIALVLKVDTSIAIAGIVTSIAGANAAQGIFDKKKKEKVDEPAP